LCRWAGRRQDCSLRSRMRTGVLAVGTTLVTLSCAATLIVRPRRSASTDCCTCAAIRRDGAASVLRAAQSRGDGGPSQRDPHVSQARCAVQCTSHSAHTRHAGRSPVPARTCPARTPLPNRALRASRRRLRRRARTARALRLRPARGRRAAAGVGRARWPLNSLHIDQPLPLIHWPRP
jgi:hypothetical protein